MKKIKENKIALLCIIITIAFAYFFQQYGMKDYERFNKDTISYQKATVKAIKKENVTYDETLQIYLGTQELEVEIPYTNTTETIINYLTKTHNVHAQVGSKIIVNVDEPENIKPYITLYNYDRSIGLYASLALLVLAIIFIGGKKGVKTILGLLYTLYLVVYVLLPTIFSGYSPILISVLCAILSTTVTLLLLNGEKIKTAAAILATTLGVLISLLCFLLVSYLLHINGFSSDEIEGLILISSTTNLQIKDLLFAGVLISSLGAIMDVGLSIVSALYEVYSHNNQLNRKQLFTSGMEIGKDMIGTMSNTLILAFTGSAFISLLVFISYKIEINQLLNSNFLTLEIAQGVCGTIGIVLTVPIASLMAAILLTRKQKIHHEEYKTTPN